MRFNVIMAEIAEDGRVLGMYEKIANFRYLPDAVEYIEMLFPGYAVTDRVTGHVLFTKPRGHNKAIEAGGSDGET